MSAARIMARWAKAARRYREEHAAECLAALAVYAPAPATAASEEA